MKTITKTLNELNALNEMIGSQNIMQMSFSKKANLSIARNVRKIQDELKEYIDKRTDLIHKYTNGSDSITRDNPKWNDFIEELKELGSVDATLNINTITFEDLPDNATPMVCALLDFMIEDEQDEEA